MSDLIKLVRPAQWAKNGFVFAPIFFAQQITDFDKLLDTFWAFIAFSLAASFIYCFNDLLDIESDRNHPQKCHRPLASGSISKVGAIVVMSSLLAASAIIVSLTLSQSLVPYLLGGYLLMNLAYTIKLKHIAIVDVFIIAIGFVLRLFVGGAAASVTLSHWIVLMTFLLALFMAFAKRRDDVLILDETGVKARPNIARYNITFINGVLSLISGVTIVCYIMYTVSPEVIDNFHTPHLYVTSIFVIAAILRYMQLTQVDEKSGSPTKILYKDRFIQTTIFLWAASFAFIIYV